MIFGGWNKKNLDNACILKENHGDYNVIKSDALQVADTFLLNGVRLWNFPEKEITIFGTEGVHQLDEKTRKFIAL